MYRLKLLVPFLVFVALVSPGITQEKGAAKLEILVPHGHQPPPELQNMEWLVFPTENFSIIAIEQNHGKYLESNIEKIKTWTLTRWGLPDVKFAAECRVYCVPNRELLKKLFGLSEPTAEVRREKDGSIKISGLWLVMDGNPTELIPSALTLVCMKELEQSMKSKFGHWFHRGVMILNSTLPQIRGKLVTLDQYIRNDRQMFFSKSLFSMTAEDWKKLTLEQRDLFDREAAATVLLMRKELGQKNLLRFAVSDNSESSLSGILGYTGYDEFDSTLKRYMLHLSQDIRNKRTPDSYLQIRPVRRK